MANSIRGWALFTASQPFKNHLGHGSHCYFIPINFTPVLKNVRLSLSSFHIFSTCQFWPDMFALCMRPHALLAHLAPPPPSLLCKRVCASSLQYGWWDLCGTYREAADSGENLVSALKSHQPQGLWLIHTHTHSERGPVN